MKYLGKFIGVLVAVSAVTAACVMTAFADGGQEPEVTLKESGVSNQYTLGLDDFSSNFESVQFDICIDRKVDAPDVEWKNNSSAHFQLVDTKQENGKTVLTVYVDRLSPIANSNNTDLADLTFHQAVPASSFSVEGDMIALDENQEKTVFEKPSLKVTSASQGGDSSSSSGGSGWSGSSDDDDDDSSSSSSSRETSGTVRVASTKNNTNTVLNWNSVSKSSSGKTVSVSVKDSQVISQDIFRQAADNGSSLKLDYGDFVWVFDTSKGVSIPSNRNYYDFSVKKIQYKNLSAAVENSDLLQFEISHSGPLPCRGTLSFNVGSSHAGENVYLSYYNENDALLQYLSSSTVSSDGTVSFTFIHASKYVLSLKNVWGSSSTIEKNEVTSLATAGGAGSGGIVNIADSSNPNTGTVNIVVQPEDKVENTAESSESQVLSPTGGTNIPDGGKEDNSALQAINPAGTEENGSTNENSSSRSVTPVLVLFLVIAVAVIIAVVLKLRVIK